MRKIMIVTNFNFFNQFITFKLRIHGMGLFCQLTFSLGHIRWGWTPPQFQNTYIYP